MGVDMSRPIGAHCSVHVYMQMRCAYGEKSAHLYPRCVGWPNLILQGNPIFKLIVLTQAVGFSFLL